MDPTVYMPQVNFGNRECMIYLDTNKHVLLWHLRCTKGKYDINFSLSKAFLKTLELFDEVGEGFTSSMFSLLCQGLLTSSR